MTVPAIEILKDAFNELNEWTATTQVAEEHHPSALLLTFEPTRHNNARIRITGDPDALVQVLFFGLKDPNNAEFARAFCEALTENVSAIIENAAE